MSDFKSENAETKAKLESKAEVVASETRELPDPNEAAPKKPSTSFGDWKARLAAAKVKVVPAVGVTPPSIPTPAPIPNPDNIPGLESANAVDAPKPKDMTEAEIGAQVIEQEKLVQKSDVVLNAEALFYELSGDQTVDDREVFKQVFIARINGALGLNLDQIRDQILAAHQVIYNERIGIQALLAYRAELLKDASSEEREKRLKEDFKFKPAKTPKAGNGEVKEKKAKSDKKEDPFAQMRRTMIDKFKAKGKTAEEAAALADKKIAALKGDD